MAETKPERRSQNRITVSLPVTVRPLEPGAEQHAFTRDLSRNGVFFYADSQIGEGSQLEMVLMLPPEITSGERQWVCCQASVVRVEKGTGRNFGVAAVIHRFDILPEIPE